MVQPSSICHSFFYILKKPLNLSCFSEFSIICCYSIVLCTVFAPERQFPPKSFSMFYPPPRPEVRKDTLASTPPATDYSAAGLAALKAAQSAPPPMPDPQSPPKTEKTLHGVAVFLSVIKSIFISQAWVELTFFRVPFAHALPQSVIPEGLTLPQNLEV